VTRYPASPSHHRALLIPFVLSFTYIRKLDAAIVATRYVYQLRGEKREARMPNRMRPQSDLRPLMPGIRRYTDASGATVYSSHSYQPLKGHAREVSAYSLAKFDFEEGIDDLSSAGPHMVNLEAIGSEDGNWEDNKYRDCIHEDRYVPGLHDMENHEDEAGLSRTSSRTTMAHDRKAPEGAFSTQ
jgi:hypothetical protein